MVIVTMVHGVLFFGLLVVIALNGEMIVVTVKLQAVYKIANGNSTHSLLNRVEGPFGVSEILCSSLDQIKSLK